MESVALPTASRALEQANEILSHVLLPPEIENVTVAIGPDHHGEMALWLKLNVKNEVKDTSQSIRSIVNFARDLQSKIIDSGIGYFPYTSVEQSH